MKLFITCMLVCLLGACSLKPEKITLDPPVNLISLPETETESTLTIIWDKPDESDNIKGYDVYINETFAEFSPITNITLSGLEADTEYEIFVVSKGSKGNKSKNSEIIKAKTKPAGNVFNILEYGAVPNSEIINTEAIQQAINECTKGGTVFIPEGTFLSGALFLKSDMTLYIAKGGVLQGTTNPEDYLPIIKSRFEGWEVQSFSSLITAGEINFSGGYNVQNLSIRGEGTIAGGGSVLGDAMIEERGLRGRGRLICLMNCENVNIQGLTIKDTPCWTIHYTFSKNVTCHDLSIFSTARNGDGIDPDSSIDSYIFNCIFNTGDDCIAIKSGKNPEGNIVAKPCENVYVSNCYFEEGHSVAIGSEISGGVKNVKIVDCEIGNLHHGLQVKTTKDRGGYVENLTVKDCSLMQIKVVTSVNYNNDGESAPDLSLLKNFWFINLDMKNSDKDPVIYIEGFDKPERFAQDFVLKNIQLPDSSNVFIKDASNIVFENVLTVDQIQPAYEIINSIDVNY